MKVLTLTTQYANNMGALLQCFALSKYLNSQKDIECEVLQYLPKGHNRSWTIFHKPRGFRDILKLLYQMIRVDQLIKLRNKRKKVRKFINTYIPLTKETYTRDEIISCPPKAAAIIVGSDQIWNFKYRQDLTYFLDFLKENTLKISYAASIADNWTKEQSQKIAPVLQTFDSISIRESGNLPCVNSALKDKEATVVCDPVFLLGKDEWNEIKSNPSIEEPYIFCYFLSVSPLAVKAVAKIRELTGCKIVHLNLNALDKFNSDIVITEADPSEFIGLISNATYVCTNSFHCSAFSIIYKKNFTFVPKNMANERITQLENLFGINVMLNVQNIENLSLSQLQTNYTDKESSENAFIEYSKEFLKQALNGKNRISEQI